MTAKTEAHIHHAVPLKVYLAVGAALLILTAITVGVSFIHLGHWNIVVALAIAAVKASLVALFFMHLLYDKKLYLTIFLIAIMFLAVFIGFTMLDTMKRGDIDKALEKPIEANASIYENRTSQAAPQDSLLTEQTSGSVKSQHNK